MTRALWTFLQRVQRDPLFARSLFRAPAQTLDRVRGLHGQERARLLDLVRSGTLGRVFPPTIAKLWVGLGGYMKTYSVRRGEPIRACIAFAGGFEGPSDITNPVVSWTIIRVTGFQGVGEPVGDLAWTGAMGSMNPPNVGEPSWNAEEVGYGWPESFGWQDGDGNTSLVSVPDDAQLGLHAIVGSYGGNDLIPLFFLVRPRAAIKAARPIMLCWPWSTTLAYTDRVSTTGHIQFTNLYDSWEPTRLRHVSLDRPIQFRPYEHEAPLAIWKHLTETMQMSPELIDHCTSFDLDEQLGILSNSVLFISAGHDEYWSREMRDNVETFVEAGGNAAFFSANTCWWRVRFEGPDKRTMTCHKSALDDPAALVDPNEATGTWCSTNRPENLMTGVSYRRGTQGGVPDAKYTIPKTRKADPLLLGVSVATFPAIGTISTYESDGADFVVDDEGTPHATGADGSQNFTILATLDQTSVGIRQRGRATMGYFSRKNGGRVFTAGTTDWYKLLSDETVRTITTNVVTIFSKASSGPGSITPPPKRPHPGMDWRRLQATPSGHAIVTLVQGHLFLDDHDVETLRRTDPENPQTPFTDTSIHKRLNANGYGADLFGADLFAASDDGIDYIYLPIPNNSQSFASLKQNDQSQVPPDGRCQAIASIYDVGTRPCIYGMIQPTGESARFLYTFVEGGKPWRRLGRPIPDIVALAATDGKLFGVGTDQRIYCRDGTGVDQVWAPICPPPIPGGTTLSIAAYYGRLFALADPQPPHKAARHEKVGSQKSIDLPEPASPLGAFRLSPDRQNPALSDRAPLIPITPQTLSRGLYWRTANSSFGAIHPHMLFLDAYNQFAIGTLEASGHFTTTGGGALPINMVYSSVVRVSQDVVLFYDHQTQHSWLYRFYGDGTAELIQEDDWGERWEQIVYVHAANSSDPERLFFYRPDGDGNSVGLIGRFEADEQDRWSFVVEDHRGDYGRWDVVISTWSGRLLFYDRQLGAISWGQVDSLGKFTDEGGLGVDRGFEQLVPAGNEYVLFYKSGTYNQNSEGIALRISERGAEQVGLMGDFQAGWFGASANGLLLFLKKNIWTFPAVVTGAATAFGVFDAGGGNPLESLNEFPNSAFGTNWERIVGLGVLT